MPAQHKRKFESGAIPAAIALIIALIALPITVSAVQKRQEIRSFARVIEDEVIRVAKPIREKLPLTGDKTKPTPSPTPTPTTQPLTKLSQEGIEKPKPTPTPTPTPISLVEIVTKPIASFLNPTPSPTPTPTPTPTPIPTPQTIVQTPTPTPTPVQIVQQPTLITPSPVAIAPSPTPETGFGALVSGGSPSPRPRRPPGLAAPALPREALQPEAGRGICIFGIIGDCKPTPTPIPTPGENLLVECSLKKDPLGILGCYAGAVVKNLFGAFGF